MSRDQHTSLIDADSTSILSRLRGKANPHDFKVPRRLDPSRMRLNLSLHCHRFLEPSPESQSIIQPKLRQGRRRAERLFP